MRSMYTSTIMNMSADVYIQENIQDTNTGAISRHWEYNKTIKCHVFPQKNTGASTRSDGKKFNGPSGKYTESLELRGKFLDRLSKRWRISGIKTADGEVIFKEIDRLSEIATIFEVVSCHATSDPFGRIAYFDVTLERVNIQNNDTD